MLPSLPCNLSQWGVPTGMIGTAVGDDLLGHHVARSTEGNGRAGQSSFYKEIQNTARSECLGQKRRAHLFLAAVRRNFETLDTADLSLIKKAKLLYVDWYDGDHIVRAMEEAKKHNVPVFLNFEHGHKHPELLKKYAGMVTICQAVTDAAQIGKKQAMLLCAQIHQVGHKDCHHHHGQVRDAWLCRARRSSACMRRRSRQWMAPARAQRFPQGLFMAI